MNNEIIDIFTPITVCLFIFLIIVGVLLINQYFSFIDVAQVVKRFDVTLSKKTLQDCITEYVTENREQLEQQLAESIEKHKVIMYHFYIYTKEDETYYDNIDERCYSLKELLKKYKTEEME